MDDDFSFTLLYFYLHFSMKSSISVRLVKVDDALDMLAIYGPLVLNTATSFETEVPTLSAFEERIKAYSEKAPWLVAEIQGKVVGYAYATDHRSRQAYQWNQEVTVYVHPEYRKLGIAKKLYLLLLDMLKAMNFCKAIAVITLPNDASIGFHRAIGFRHIGEMKNIGYKNGKWYNTSWWDLDLDTNQSAPKEIVPIESVLSKYELGRG